MPKDYDPTDWVDEWPIPGLSDSDRKRIKAVLLKAHAAYLRSGAPEGGGFIEPMEESFDGIARVLFDANLLSDAFLGGPLRVLIIEFALRAKWLIGPVISGKLQQNPIEAFPGYWAHPGPWIAFNSSFKFVFGAPLADWRARLLEREAMQTARPNIQEGICVPAPSDCDKQQEIITRRKVLLDDYKAAVKGVSNRRIYNAANSQIYHSEFSKWMNGTLPDSSATTINFERFLRAKKPPVPRTQKR